MWRCRAARVQLPGLAAAEPPQPLPLSSRRPSDAKKKKAAQKKSAGGKGKAANAENAGANGAAENGSLSVSSLSAALALEEAKSNDRSCTGVLMSHPQSRDVQLGSFGLLYHGHELLTDTTLELNYGR